MRKRMKVALLALLLAAWATAAAEKAEEAAVSPAPDAETEPAAYVLVSTATGNGWLPLPTEGETTWPVRQMRPDGTEAVNILHLTPDSVWMEEANCDNRDCIAQGKVTLENRTERILSNMIICLPNQVILALYTPEELLEMTRE